MSGIKGVGLDELTADAVDFNNDTNGFISEDVQAAIEEVFAITQNASRSYTFAQYNGQALSGRYLEIFEGISTDEAPLYTPDSLEVLTIVSATTEVNSTCAIGWYDISGGLPGTLLHTTTFTAQHRVIENSGILFSVPATAELAIKIDSGSIKKPHIYFIVRGT